MRGLTTMRRRAGLSMAALAARLGVTRAAVSYWETGHTWPSARLLPQIAEVLGCSIDELFRGAEENSTSKTEETP